ncbi:hypothetical protein JKG47_23295, partial [Acidithiobacillus sp. MC6.1]|nr:hypothetical protein [Acidithiobacillus sp. MC6.1]
MEIRQRTDNEDDDGEGVELEDVQAWDMYLVFKTTGVDGENIDLNVESLTVTMVPKAHDTDEFDAPSIADY